MISKVCACGMWITGTSESQLDYNLKKHIKGKRHKKQITAKGGKK